MLKFLCKFVHFTLRESNMTLKKKGNKVSNTLLSQTDSKAGSRFAIPSANNNWRKNVIKLMTRGQQAAIQVRRFCLFS